jgi:hypothetical protein
MTVYRKNPKCDSIMSKQGSLLVSVVGILSILGSLTTGCTGVPSISSPTMPLPEVPYIGQKPPGLIPEIFAPGIVSDPLAFEYSGTFSPDGAEYYFARESGNLGQMLMFTRFENGTWTSPSPCAFTGGYRAAEPHLTFDNHTLYFMWNRTVPPDQPLPPEESKYYFVERTPTGWTEPKLAGLGMFMSSTRDGQIYTTDMSKRATGGATFLARVTTSDHVFTGFEKLNIKPRAGTQAHPCIAPDGSYILFDVNGGSYLYVSFKKPDGTWGDGIDLTKHGFDPLAGGASISPDGRYLFFALGGDIWWIDIKAVESLKPK